MASDLTDYQKEGLQQNHDIGIALLDTGGRLNEVLRLQWKDVDVKGKTIVLWRTKTRNGTTLMMTERLYQVMKRRFDNKRDATWVFPGINGPALSSGARIRKAIKRAGLSDFRLHDTGNGACETVYLSEFEVINKANAGMHSFYQLAKWFTILAMIGYVVAFFNAPVHQRYR
jgi:hypothetical protein